MCITSGPSWPTMTSGSCSWHRVQHPPLHHLPSPDIMSEWQTNTLALRISSSLGCSGKFKMYLHFPECHGTTMRMKIQQQGGGRRKGMDNHIFAVLSYWSVSTSVSGFQPKCPDLTQALTFRTRLLVPFICAKLNKVAAYCLRCRMKNKINNWAIPFQLLCEATSTRDGAREGAGWEIQRQSEGKTRRSQQRLRGDRAHQHHCELPSRRTHRRGVSHANVNTSYCTANYMCALLLLLIWVSSSFSVTSQQQRNDVSWSRSPSSWEVTWSTLTWWKVWILLCFRRWVNKAGRSRIHTRLCVNYVKDRPL